MKNKFNGDNLINIQEKFLVKIRSDPDYKPGAPITRVFRKTVVLVAAAVIIVISTTVFAIAVGFDPMSAWRGLFEQESAVEMDMQVTSAGISMNVLNLYTDGRQVVLEITLQDMIEERLSEDIDLITIDPGKYGTSILDSYYDFETGLGTYIVLLEFMEDLQANDSFTFTIDSILVDYGFTPAYHPFEFDLYDTAVNSVLQPEMIDEEWLAAAQESPVPEYSGDCANRIHRYENKSDQKNIEVTEIKWLPLDTSVEGEELIHWISVTGVGYADGYLHIQYRYNDIFGIRKLYFFKEPAIIDNAGNILVSSEEENELLDYDEIICSGYKEQRFYVGSLDNIKNLGLAWTGLYVNHAIDGEWSVEIDLVTIGESISGSVEVSDHTAITEISYKLSPSFFETEIKTALEFPDFDLYMSNDIIDKDLINLLDFRQETYHLDFAIILNDGTKIDTFVKTPFDSDDRSSFVGRIWEGKDQETGMTLITCRHVLDGSFTVDDVAEIIVYGVSINIGQQR